MYSHKYYRLVMYIVQYINVILESFSVSNLIPFGTPYKRMMFEKETYPENYFTVSHLFLVISYSKPFVKYFQVHRKQT